MMDDSLEHHPFMEQALLDEALLGEESSLDDSARAFSPLLVSEDQSNSEQSETRESQKSTSKNNKSNCATWPFTPPPPTLCHPY